MKVPLIPDGCAPCCLEEDTSIPCCLSLSCLWELVDVCWLVSLSLLGLSMISSLISSSIWGYTLCLLASGCCVDPLAGVVSSLSRFLLLSSLRGVYNAGIYGASVCSGGACPWSYSFEVVCWSVIVSYSVSTTSLPFAIPVAGVDLSWAACGAAAVDVPSLTCYGSLNDTCPKESKSRVFSKFFPVCSIFLLQWTLQLVCLLPSHLGWQIVLYLGFCNGHKLIAYISFSLHW